MRCLELPDPTCLACWRGQGDSESAIGKPGPAPDSRRTDFVDPTLECCWLGSDAREEVDLGMPGPVGGSVSGAEPPDAGWNRETAPFMARNDLAPSTLGATAKRRHLRTCLLVEASKKQHQAIS